MSYTEAPATKMLATNCVCCGRPLVDACSVELGIGPDCREGVFPEGVDQSDRKIANEHVFHASVAAQNGHVAKVLEYSEMIRALGFAELADKVASRFIEATAKAKKNPDITISEDGEFLIVQTPFRRGDKEAFIAAWRNIPGRSYDRASKGNKIPKSQKAALWSLLKEFFPGKRGMGPSGAFNVPKAPKAVKKQPELNFKG